MNTNKNQKQDTLKEMLDILKGDYNFPVKLWVWGKVVKEWAGIIIGSTIVLAIVLFLVFAIKGAGEKSEHVNSSQQTITLPMKDIVKFMAICQRSVNKRQEVLKSLMETIESYKDSKLDKENIEQKIKSLSLDASLCNATRGNIIDQFTQTHNPFDNPEISTALNELLVDSDGFADFFNEDKKTLDPQLESEEWGKLCALCQSEVKKANNELIQILKAEEIPPTLENIEGSEVQTSVFKLNNL